MIACKYYTFEELLNETGRIVYTSVGCSMLPLLREKRDIVEIRKKGPDRCKKYDVVLYKYGSMYILHRILRITPSGYIIAGDNNTYLEKNITDNMIIGVMVRIIRDGKNIYPTNWKYRLYVHIWCDCYPVRMILSRIWVKLRNLLKHKRKQENHSI